MEYEWLFTTSLHMKLKERLVGKVFTRVYNDELYVEINTYGNLTFVMYIDDFANKVQEGWTTDEAVEEIVKKYKRYIINRFFKESSSRI